jgi:predicted porin
MNKKLIALAVASAFVAPAAMAQTANPVTLYGKVYATFESISANGGTSAQNDATKNRSRVEDQASRLGVRGTEDLGGGLKAVFQLETAFKPDQNNTTFAARNSGVGLQGGWGTIMMGRWDTPFKTVTGNIDPFGDVTIGGFKTVANDQGNFDRRDQNVVQYWSPNWSGFSMRLMFQANENKTATTDPKDYGGSLEYKGGPVYLTYAYEQHHDQVGNPGVTSSTAAGKKETGHAFGGNFKFGSFQFGALYEVFKKSDREDQKAILANIIWNIGNNQLIYQYGQAKDGYASGTTQLDCKSHVFGWQYNFSKRTFFLAQYVEVKNDNTASNCGNNTFNNAPFAISAGQDPKGVSFGISHVF